MATKRPTTKPPKPQAGSYGTLRKDSVKITAENEIAEGRLKVIGELSQRQADRIVGAVQKEEQGVASKMAQAAASGNDPLFSVIKYYQEELQDIYYSSTKEPVSFVGDDPIKIDYLPKLEVVITNIKAEDILKDTETDVHLLLLANKIKSILEKRSTLTGKAKSTAGKFLKNDVMSQVGATMLGGIQEKIPILGMAITAFGNRRKKNTYAMAAMRARSTAQSDQRYNQRFGEQTSDGDEPDDDASDDDASDDSENTQTAGNSATLTAAAALFGGGASATRADESGISASGAGGGSGQNGIIKILTHHTTLLEKIFGVSADMLQFFKDQAAKAVATSEEGNLESQPGGQPGEQRLTGLGTATEETGGKKGGGFLGTLLNAYSLYRGGKLLRGGLGLLRGGMGILRGGAARMGLLGGAAALSGGAATASVAGDVAGTVATTATKAVGEETAEAVGKKVVKEAGEAAVKQKAKKGLIKGIIRKMVPKTIAKLFGKSILGVGALIGGAFAVGKLMKGDWTGAGLEVAGGIGGPLTALPATAIGLSRDVHQEAYGNYPGLDAESLANMGEIKDQVTGEIQEQVDKLTGNSVKEGEGEPSTPPAAPAPPAPAPPAAPAPSVAAPAPPAPKPSFGRRLFNIATRASLAVATGGLSEVFRTVSSLNSSGAGAPVSGAPGSGANLQQVGDGALAFTDKSGSKAKFDQLNPDFKKRVEAAAGEYYQQTGKALVVNSSKRDSSDQIRLWQESEKAGRTGRTASGMPIGRPGRSRHEKGTAIDIQNYNDPVAVAAMNRQGLIQAVPGDPVHFQLGTGSPEETASQGPNAATNPLSSFGGGRSGGGGGGAGYGPSTPPSTTPITASPSPTGDGSAQSRADVTAGLMNPSIQGGGTGGGVLITNVKGGDTTMAGGGGGNATTLIPAPIDREPTIRRVLDGALS